MLAKVKLNNTKSWLIFKRNISVVSGTNVQESVKQFEEIPGPKGILGIGNFYNYFKYFGKFWMNENNNETNVRCLKVITVGIDCTNVVLIRMPSMGILCVRELFLVLKWFGFLIPMIFPKYSMMEQEIFHVVEVIWHWRNIEMIDRMFIALLGYYQREFKILNCIW